MTCIGCNLANRVMNTYTVYENDNLNVFLDLFPYSEGHLLILPKAHYESLDDLPEDLLCEIMSCAQTMMKALKKAFDIENIIVLQNNGDINSLKHYHLHLVPHDKDHDLSTLYDPKVHDANDEATLTQIQSKIIEALKHA